MISQRRRSSSPRTQRTATSSTVRPSASTGSHGSPATTGPGTVVGGGDGGAVAARSGGGTAGLDLAAIVDGGGGLTIVAGGGGASVVARGSGVDTGTGGFGARPDCLGRAAAVEVEVEVDGTAVGGGAMLAVGTTIGGTTRGATRPAEGGADPVCGDPKVTQPITAQSVAWPATRAAATRTVRRGDAARATGSVTTANFMRFDRSPRDPTGR
jgi:hypothetical protein